MALNQSSAGSPVQNAGNLGLAGLIGDTDHPLRISPYLFLVPLIAYLAICAVFRNHRLRTALEVFPYTDRRSFASMTQSDAYYIQLDLVELEFPTVMEMALQFALFRTYGMPSISKLLVQTAELCNPLTSPKRYQDTVCLIAEFMGYHPKSQRATDAISRMNFLHNHYIKQGKISNDDLLYTLSLFALEPARWVKRWEWREFADFEKCAVAVFWKAMGDAMDIDYAPLKSGGEGGAGWVDGLQWLEEIEAWATRYEEQNMVPDPKNHATAEETVSLLLWYVPTWVKPLGKKMVTVLMGERLRKAMMYEKPALLYVILAHLVLTVRKYFIRFLCLPRWGFMRYRLTTSEASEQGKYFMTRSAVAPYYVKPTFLNRYGPLTLLTRIMGLPLPGDDGERFWPSGYRIPEIGPRILQGKGEEFMRQEMGRVAQVRAIRCPFGRLKTD